VFCSFCFVFIQPSLWSSGQSSWLQIQRPRLDSQRYKIFWEVVGLEQGPLSLLSTIEELLGRKSSGCCLETREYGRRDPSRWPRGTLYQQKLALTSPTSCGRSVGIGIFLERGTPRQVRKAISPPSVSSLSRKCGILDVSQARRPPRPVTGVALLLFFFLVYCCYFLQSLHWPMKYSHLRSIWWWAH
jgi:hypothetical protein